MKYGVLDLNDRLLVFMLTKFEFGSWTCVIISWDVGSDVVRFVCDFHSLSILSKIVEI
ncbi:hypothetical protein SOVF_129800 [Spinacia oleracea]|nr:hypothetical protein SOVF_129800 [Spinacia oleracea]